jgi:hypothetical protein
MVTRKEVDDLRNGQTWDKNKKNAFKDIIHYLDWLDLRGDGGGGGGGGGDSKKMPSLHLTQEEKEEEENDEQEVSNILRTLASRCT